MGKKKWYVVTVGRNVGVFETWSEVQPLINGVSGALHESFTTEEEAREVFERQLDRGNTKIVGGNQLRNVLPQGTPPALAPLAFSTNSSSERSSPQMQSRSDASAPRTSSSEMAALHSSLRRQSTHDATLPRTRSVSPPVVHPNVSYTRGASSNLTPRNHRRGKPRAVVRTPTDLQSYPSDDQSATDISSVRDIPSTPSTPSRASTRRAIVVETPSHLHSYPSDQESIASPPADSILSPLSSPRFMTPEALSPRRLSRRSSVASSTSTPRHQHSPMARSASSRDHQEASFQPHIYLVSPFPGDHSQCQHTCPHCRVVSVYSSGHTTPVSLLQPMHVQNIVHDPIHDPRSPMGRTNTIPNHVNSTLFGRPSPRMNAEHQMSALFVR